MANLLLSAWAWIKSIFASKAAGVIWQTILGGVKTKVVSLLTDPVVQLQAWNIAVTLRENTEMTGVQKAVEFNKQMAVWLKENGYLSFTTSMINTVRELAVQAIAVKEETNETIVALPMPSK